MGDKVCQHQGMYPFSMQSTGLDFRQKEAAGWAKNVNAIISEAIARTLGIILKFLD